MLETKKQHVENLLKEIEMKRKINHKKFRRLKIVSNCLVVTSSTLNAISVSSIVLSLGPHLPAFVILSLCATSFGGLINVATLAAGLNQKIMAYNVSSHQYADLYRDIAITLKRNHLTSEDYDNLLIDINHRLTLIEDSEEI
jgi:hypothetical protein